MSGKLRFHTFYNFTKLLNSDNWHLASGIWQLIQFLIRIKGC